MHKQALIDELRRRVPSLLAIYAFGSRIRGDANGESDLAVLVAGHADTLFSDIERDGRVHGR